MALRYKRLRLVAMQALSRRFRTACNDQRSAQFATQAYRRLIRTRSCWLLDQILATVIEQTKSRWHALILEYCEMESALVQMARTATVT